MDCKAWENCPTCGAQGTMKYENDVTETRTAKDGRPVEIPGLDGFFCSVCGEGILSDASEKRIAAEIEGRTSEDHARNATA